MTTAPDPDLHRLALAVEQLNGKMETGFATVRGDISLLSRGEQTNARRLDGLEEDVEELKARRFPVPMIGGLCGVAGLLLTGFQMAGRA